MLQPSQTATQHAVTMAACFYFIEERFMKMSDVFELGVCLEVRGGHIYNRYDEFTNKQADAVEDAINNHDRMADEIAELREFATVVVNLSIISDVPIAITSKAKQLLNK